MKIFSKVILCLSVVFSYSSSAANFSYVRQPNPQDNRIINIDPSPSLFPTSLTFSGGEFPSPLSQLSLINLLKYEMQLDGSIKFVAFQDETLVDNLWISLNRIAAYTPYNRAPEPSHEDYQEVLTFFFELDRFISFRLAISYSSRNHFSKQHKLLKTLQQRSRDMSDLFLIRYLRKSNVGIDHLNELISVGAQLKERESDKFDETLAISDALIKALNSIGENKMYEWLARVISKDQELLAKLFAFSNNELVNINDRISLGKNAPEASFHFYFQSLLSPHLNLIEKLFPYLGNKTRVAVLDAFKARVTELRYHSTPLFKRKSELALALWDLVKGKLQPLVNLSSDANQPTLLNAYSSNDSLVNIDKIINLTDSQLTFLSSALTLSVGVFEVDFNLASETINHAKLAEVHRVIRQHFGSILNIYEINTGKPAQVFLEGIPVQKPKEIAPLLEKTVNHYPLSAKIDSVASKLKNPLLRKACQWLFRIEEKN